MRTTNAKYDSLALEHKTLALEHKTLALQHKTLGASFIQLEESSDLLISTSLPLAEKVVLKASIQSLTYALALMDPNSKNVIKFQQFSALHPKTVTEADFSLPISRASALRIAGQLRYVPHTLSDKTKGAHQKKVNERFKAFSKICGAVQAEKMLKVFEKVLSSSNPFPYHVESCPTI